ncbi:MAG: DUF2490 domain-containing protein [Flavobacteriales bacterium]
MKHSSYLIIFFFSLITIEGYTQKTDNQSDAWFFLLNHYKLNDKWSAGSEIHWRNTRFLQDKEQLLLRPFIAYKPNKGVSYTAGYTFIQSYSTSYNNLPISKPEHNIWEQVSLKQTLNKFRISHRFRIEHRFQGDISLNDNAEHEINGFEFSNRFRYRLTLKRSLTDKLFIHLFDEIWIKMNDEFKFPVYGKNWFYAGLGYKIIKNGNLQLAYLHQNINKGNGFFVRNPTVQFTFQYDFK